MELILQVDVWMVSMSTVVSVTPTLPGCHANRRLTPVNRILAKIMVTAVIGTNLIVVQI